MKSQEFFEHLDVFRTCLIRSLTGICIGVAVAFIFVSYAFELLTHPYLRELSRIGAPIGTALQSLSPGDTFQMTLQSALLLGLGLSSPWFGYQLWTFFGPALHRSEKKYAGVFIFSTIVCFLAGAAFAYFVTLPLAIRFFYQYTSSLGITPAWTITNYFSFVITFIVCFGVVFELPVAIAILAYFGVATPELLSKYRRHAIVAIFIIAAIFTPPDIISQLMMGIPMIALYEISIIAAKVICRMRRSPSVVEEIDQD